MTFNEIDEETMYIESARRFFLNNLSNVNKKYPVTVVTVLINFLPNNEKKENFPNRDCSTLRKCNLNFLNISICSAISSVKS